ncbi:hypothetical protein K435DRAFT_865053 [Dendrothele bispora CBS 962.96]|uniref:Shikimate dehydrogenase substrate binding N-terminal domain-containing protein n=1 Tax=Dendrothele bispora (strain CBS 962.96) TaxID=1314807 RepID=A0A4V4HE41_DENBC|nr:hypothetical protein K435DRAFT_865053 [Dendrothele bispora CBS 962.96]
MSVYRVAIVELEHDSGLREVHHRYSSAFGFEVTFDSVTPDELNDALQSLRIGDLNAILVSRDIDCPVDFGVLKLDVSAAASGSINFVTVVDGALCGFNTDIPALHFSITSAVAYPEFRTTLIMGTGPSVKAAVYVLSQYFDCSSFYVFEPRIDAYDDFVKFCEATNIDIQMSRVTDRWMVPMHDPIQCVVTDSSLDLQSDAYATERWRLLTRVFASLRANMYSRHRGLFLNLGPEPMSRFAVERWDRIARNELWTAIRMDELEQAFAG